jgi:hypothetical protein
MVPALRSCLKTTATRSNKSVHFTESGGWNVHRIRAFQPDSCPNTFLSLADADVVPSIRGRVGPQDDGYYQLRRNDIQIRWPPLSRRLLSLAPRSRRCFTNAMIAARLRPMGYHTPVTVLPSKAFSVGIAWTIQEGGAFFVPALDDDGEDDCLDTCPGPHNHTPYTCQHFSCGYKANVKWLYSRYPE